MVYGLIASVFLNFVLFFLFVESLRSNKEATDILMEITDCWEDGYNGY